MSKKIILVSLFVFSCTHSPSTNPDIKILETTTSDRQLSSESSGLREIIGYLDQVGDSVTGWTCLKGSPLSLTIKIFIGGPYGQGTEVDGNWIASSPNELAVNERCQNKNSSHRFSVKIPSSILNTMPGQPVYVYGVHPKTKSLEWLNFNGKFVTPDPNPKPVMPIDFKRQKIIGDIGFTNGFKVIDTDATEIYTNRLPGEHLRAATWEIAQWSTLESIPNIATRDNNYYTWSNQYKSLKVGIAPNTNTEVIFGIDSNAEYSGVYRKSTDTRGWPHLLISQTIAKPENFKNYRPLSYAKKMILDLHIQVLAANNIQKSGYDPNVHTSQFVLYFTLQNLNPQTNSYKKYIWFGVPLYDARYDFVPAGAFIDKGTQSLIWVPDGREILDTSLHDLKLHRINKDLLPYMKKAIDHAYAKGILDTKNLNDFFIGHMNTGFEVPGLAQVVVRIKNLSLVQVN